MSEAGPISPEGQPQDETSQSDREATASSDYPLLTTRYSLLAPVILLPQRLGLPDPLPRRVPPLRLAKMAGESGGPSERDW